MKSRKRSHFLQWSLAVAVAVHPAFAMADDELASRVQELLREAALGEQVSLLVVEGERELVRLRADERRNPASNMKVVTAAAALHTLGPQFTMRTAVFANAVDGVASDLVLRGGGDPSLTRGDLLSLAQDVAARGIRQVDRIWIDGSYFDEQVLPPSFEQQPNEAATFRAAIGAVSVDRGSFLLRIRPGAVGENAHVSLWGEDYFTVDMGTTTVASGAANVIASQRELSDHRMALTLRGSVPADITLVSYGRRVEHPPLYAGYAFREALAAFGVRGQKRVGLGAGPAGLTSVATHESPALSVLLHAVGKHSDNYYAEMILKVLGAEQARPGTSARGAETAMRFLRGIGCEPGTRIVNGSGLFRGNQVSARDLTITLEAMATSQAAPEYLAHLAVAGADGTLHSRMTDLPEGVVVRAKTGTLADVVALSGYILKGSRRITFSFLANDVSGKAGVARQAIDSVVRTIAATL